VCQLMCSALFGWGQRWRCGCGERRTMEDSCITLLSSRILSLLRSLPTAKKFVKLFTRALFLSILYNSSRWCWSITSITLPFLN
jgi:hypothetical protein